MPSGVFPYPRPTKNGERSTPSASVARELTPLQPSTFPPFSSSMTRSGTRESRLSYSAFWANIISKPIGTRQGAGSRLTALVRCAHPYDPHLGLDTRPPAIAEKNIARFLLVRLFSHKGVFDICYQNVCPLRGTNINLLMFVRVKTQTNVGPAGLLALKNCEKFLAKFSRFFALFESGILGFL